MNGVSNGNHDDVAECPLCMEPLEVDDLNFYPCTCGYQICRFCWHRIRTDENELCPACRKAYPENPADFTPLSQEQISALKAEKRQRDQQRKQKITENRKHLANVRVVQKNLVFVVGLPPRLADAEILKKHEYFGKYGKIHKVVINPSTTYAGVQGPSASAYVTYTNNSDSLRAIQSVNNIMIDGRLIKTSLGTTKYCSHFMKNQQCPKSDCMYLHELGDIEASFTKEEMHQGKHQEYEKRLHDALIAQAQSANNSSVLNGKIVDNKLSSAIQNGPVHNKEAWPCLSVSPINKDGKTSCKTSNINVNRENSTKKPKSDKLKGKRNNQNTIVVKENTGMENSSQQQTNKNGNNKDIFQQEQKEQHISDQNVTAEDDVLFSDLENEIDTKAVSPSLSLTSCNSGTASESSSGKSSPTGFPDPPTQNISLHQQLLKQNKIHFEKKSSENLNAGCNEATFDVYQSNPEINSNTQCHPANGFTNNVIDASSRFPKLNFYDDNNSFFSTNSFQPFLKADQLRNTDSKVTNTNSPQLPDLLNGTESDKDRLDLERLNLLKELGNSQMACLSQHNLRENNPDSWATTKYALFKNTNQIETDELLGMQEIQKRNLLNSLGIPQALSQVLPFQQQSQQQFSHQLQNSLSSSDNMNHLHSGNMSKFFDFHKNQQNQQQYLINNLNVPPNSGSEHSMNISNMFDGNRLSNQFIDHISGSQVHKQRILNKLDQSGSPLQLNPTSLGGSQTNRLHTYSDDDLGFDPFFEIQKGFSELLENELLQQQAQNNHSKLLDNSQKSRMPPPGFGHMNAFGVGIPRAHTSKILPFMSVNNRAPSPQMYWNQQQNLNYQQQSPVHEPSSNHMGLQQTQNTKPGYGSLSDWTALDPAIVSFRQYPAYVPHQSPSQTQHNANDFLPNLNQQHATGGNNISTNYGLLDNKLRNNSFDFANRNNMLQSNCNGLHAHNNFINQQQNSSAQVNYSHSNWIHTEHGQNLFINSIANGFTNNFDKYSIPMPPGFQNTGNKSQKSECIN